MKESWKTKSVGGFGARPDAIPNRCPHVDICRHTPPAYRTDEARGSCFLYKDNPAGTRLDSAGSDQDPGAAGGCTQPRSTRRQFRSTQVIDRAAIGGPLPDRGHDWQIEIAAGSRAPMLAV